MTEDNQKQSPLYKFASEQFEEDFPKTLDKLQEHVPENFPLVASIVHPIIEQLKPFFKLVYMQGVACGYKSIETAYKEQQEKDNETN